MEPTEPIDANLDAASSAASGEQTAVTSQQASTEPAAEPTLAEVAKAAYDKATSSQEAPEGDVQNKDKTGEQDEPLVTEELTSDEPSPDDNVPFHDHPRWQEVTKKAKDLETKLTEITDRTKDWETASQRTQYHDAFMQEHAISSEDFQQVMSFLAFKSSDPARARSMLKPMWDSLASFDEGFISADVQKEINAIEQAVKDTEISRPLADKQISLIREAAKNKVLQQSAQRRTQMTAEQHQRAIANSIGTTLHTWEQAAAKKDPAFKPKAKPDQRDGVYEITCAKYAYLANVTPPRTAAEASALADKAYKEARELLLPPKPVARPLLTSARSSTAKKNGEPKTIADTVASVAAKHGYSWRPPAKRN